MLTEACNWFDQRFEWLLQDIFKKTQKSWSVMHDDDDEMMKHTGWAWDH